MAIKLHKNHSNLDTIRAYLKGDKLDIKIYNNIPEKEKHRVDGEEWELQGIKYRKENGKTIKLTKSQGDIIRDAIGNDVCHADGCNQNIKWGTSRDQYLYRRTGLCENCLIDYETKLRIAGIYPDYEKYKLESYALGSLKESKDKIKELIKYFTENTGDVTLPNEDGQIDATWVNTNRDKILKDAKADLKNVKHWITTLSKTVQLYKRLYITGAKKYKLPVYAK